MEQETATQSNEKGLKGSRRTTYVAIGAGVVVVALAAWWLLGLGSALPNSDENATAPEVQPAPSAEEGAASDIRPGERVIENGVATTLVYFTSQGFLPAEVTINAGEEVRFINRTEGAMRVGARSNLSSPFYATVVQPDVVSYGGVYQVGLTRVGLWSYENLTSSGDRAQGVIFIR